MTLSEGELLKRIRLIRDMEPLYEGDIREDSLQAEKWLKEFLRKEYRQLLETLPTEQLPMTEITDRVSVAKKGEGKYEMSLPANTVRVGEIKMEGDEQSVRIVSSDSREAQAQYSPYTRGGRCTPTGVAGIGGKIMIYGGKDESSGKAERVMAVLLPDEGEYILTPFMETALIERMRNAEN